MLVGYANAVVMRIVKITELSAIRTGARSRFICCGKCSLSAGTSCTCDASAARELPLVHTQKELYRLTSFCEHDCILTEESGQFLCPILHYSNDQEARLRWPCPIL